MAHCHIEREVVVELFSVCQFCLTHISYLVIILSFEAYEKIVLVGVEIVLAILVDVVFIVQAQRVYWELVGVLFLLFERVFHLAHVLPFLVAGAVRDIETSEKMRVQIGRCHCTCAQAPSLESVVAEGGVYRAVE